jgi:shikimate 5-dehydrogenase
MFIQQGNRSFELWTGKTFPVNLVRKELMNALKNAR